MIRQSKTLYSLLTVLLMSILMTGCSLSHSKNTLYFNRQQAIIMEPTVLVAGIVAGQPILEKHANGTRAMVTLSNTHHDPVALYYRFYWYNEQGLEVSQVSHVNEVMILGDDDAKISVDVPDKTISYVRVYLFI